MAEYIEREQAISARPEYLNPFKSEYNKGWDDCLNTIFESIKSLPAVDVQGVRHGEWISDDCGYYHCSECGFEYDEQEQISPYCPHCGAKMDKE